MCVCAVVLNGDKDFCVFLLMKKLKKNVIITLLLLRFEELIKKRSGKKNKTKICVKTKEAKINTSAIELQL